MNLLFIALRFDYIIRQNMINDFSNFFLHIGGHMVTYFYCIFHLKSNFAQIRGKQCVPRDEIFPPSPHNPVSL